MEENIKKIKYLQCTPKYRVSPQSLSEVIRKTQDSGLANSQQKPRHQVQGLELNKLLEENERLISVARPIMTKVFDCFTDKTKLLILCDLNGVIIDLLSCQEKIKWCFNRGIMLGSSFEHSSFGTNSISMAMHNQRPVVVIGDEHYCDVMKTWSCIAAPIWFMGQVIGYVDISDEAHGDLLQLTALVELMAELIECRLQQIVISGEN